MNLSNDANWAQVQYIGLPQETIRALPSIPVLDVGTRCNQKNNVRTAELPQLKRDTKQESK